MSSLAQKLAAKLTTEVITIILRGIFNPSTSKYNQPSMFIKQPQMFEELA